MATVTAFRVSDWDTPFWPGPNRNEGRFNAIGGRITQYWSLNPLTPWAEYLRGQDIRTFDDARDLRLRPWAARIQLPADTLSITFETAAEAGIAAADLIDDDQGRCRAWAQALSVSAIIVPSAALPGTRNLVLFGARARIPYAWEPVSPLLDTPADPAADFGVVPEDLVSSVRWWGATHPEFLAWSYGGKWAPGYIHVDKLGAGEAEQGF